MVNKFNDALAEHKKGNFKQALELYNQIINDDSNNCEVLFLIGTLNIQVDDNESAVKYLEKYIKLDNSNFHAFANLGIAYSNLGSYNKAIENFEQSINLNKNFYHNYNNLGNIYLKKNKYKEAIQFFDKALNQSQDLDIFFNRALAKKNNGSLDGSLNDLNFILNQNVKYEPALNLKLDILSKQKKFSEYDTLLRSIIDIEHSNKSIVEKKINYLLDQGLVSNIEHLISQLSNKYKKKFFLASLYYKKGDLPKSLELFKKCKNIKETSEVFNNIGLIYRNQNKQSEALSCFNKALMLNKNSKDAKLNISLMQLKKLNFQDGWLNYNNRPKILPCNFPEHILEYNFEKQEPIKKVLVLLEQGIGDQLFFLRILNLGFDNNFIFEIDKRLLNVYKNCYPGFIFTSNISNYYNDATHFVFLADLFKFFINDQEKIKSLYKPLEVSLPDDNFLPPKSSKSSKLNCGLSWKTTKSNLETQKVRSIKLDLLISNLKHYPFNFFNLQYGDIDKELNEINTLHSIRIHEFKINIFNDLDKLLAHISQLDFVITTDNITAHLSGVIGKKTYLLVPKFFGDIWYWPSEGKSIWYPSTEVIFYDPDNIEVSFKKLNSFLNENFN